MVWGGNVEQGGALGRRIIENSRGVPEIDWIMSGIVVNRVTQDKLNEGCAIHCYSFGRGLRRMGRGAAVDVYSGGR